MGYRPQKLLERLGKAFGQDEASSPAIRLSPKGALGVLMQAVEEFKKQTGNEVTIKIRPPKKRKK